MPSEKDIVVEARAILNASNAYTLRIQVRELLGALADEVERLRTGCSDAVIQRIEIMQEKHPDQRIELSVEPNGYCYVTRSDGNGNIQPIAEGATLGDVFNAD